MQGASVVRSAVLGAALMVTIGGFVPPADVAAATAAPSVFVRLRAGPATDALHVPAEVRWTAMTLDAGATYRLHRRVDGGAWTRIALAVPTRDRLAVTLDSWRVYEYRVAVVDAAGRVGPWTVAPAVRARMELQTEANATYAGVWTRPFSLARLEGSTRVTSDSSASVQFPIGTIGVAWVATKGPGRSRAEVLVDGTMMATVNLRATTTTYRRVVWTKTWPTAEQRTIEIRRDPAVAGALDLDGLLVLETPTTDPVLVGAGDIASCASTGDEATAELLDAIEGTVFTAGDNAYYSGSSAQFATCYDPSWGRHRDRTRPVPGNHDYFTAGAAGYKAYFGALATPRGTTWYAYDLGAWRIYALDSECALVGGCGSASPQGEWLSTDLARHPRRCVAAIWHVPRFSSGIHGNYPTMDWIWRKLDGAGAEIVVAGHDHDYERFLRQHADGTKASNGMREFVVGTGGKDLRSFGTRQLNSMARWNGSHGVLKLTLRPASYAWRFVAVPPATFSDPGSTACS